MFVYLKNNKILNNKIKYSNLTIDTSIITNHINNNITSRLQNKNPTTDKLIYSSQNPYTNGIGQFIRNSSCWINGVSNISCFSPAQLSGASWNQRAGTLITKKHIILAKHYMIPIIGGGTPLIFVDNNNNVVRRNLISYANDNLTDISIGLLDNEIPSNISIAKVLPTNYQNYIDSSQNFLSAALDQEEKALVKVWTGLLSYTTNEGSYKYINIVSPGENYLPPTLHQYSIWNETTIGGDSGNPIFIIIDNELVLLGCWHTPWSGPFITNRYNQVNNLINSLSPNEGYSLTPINLEVVYHKYS